MRSLPLRRNWRRRKMGKILNLNGQQATPEKVDPEKVFQAIATERTRKERKDLKGFVTIPDDATEEQKAYAARTHEAIDRMFLRAWFIGLQDYQIKQRALIQEQAKNAAVARALSKGGGGELKA